MVLSKKKNNLFGNWLPPQMGRPYSFASYSFK
jgi:hypothetical protein